MGRGFLRESVGGHPDDREPPRGAGRRGLSTRMAFSRDSSSASRGGGWEVGPLVGHAGGPEGWKGPGSWDPTQAIPAGRSSWSEASERCVGPSIPSRAGMPT